jgi:hypothetical protein
MHKYITAVALLLTAATVAQATADDCAFVRRTPDGFLNLRAFPIGSASVVGKVKPNDLLYISGDATCEKQGTLTICDESGGWTKVTAKWKKAANQITWVDMEGWAATRFVDFTECHGGELQKDKGQR